ncbi:ankyrin repeat domain-containing protein [Mycoplasmatota bacterium zrk1]
MLNQKLRFCIVIALLLLVISGCSKKTNEELRSDLFYLWSLEESEVDKVLNNSLEDLRNQNTKDDYEKNVEYVIYKLLDYDHLPEAKLIMDKIDNPDYESLLQGYIDYEDPKYGAEGDPYGRNINEEAVEFIVNEGNINCNQESIVKILVQHNPYQLIGYFHDGTVETDYIEYIMDNKLAESEIVKFLAKIKPEILESNNYQQKLNNELRDAVNDGFNEQTVRELLKQGADPNTPDTNGYPFIYNLTIDAINHIYLNQIGILLAAGADANYVDEHGNDLLHIAYNSEPSYGVRDTDTMLDLMASFISYGINPETLINGKYTPLTLAINYRHHILIDVIIGDGRSLDDVSEGHEAPINMAMEKEMYDVAEQLASGGANINVRNSNGNMPIHKATSLTMYELVDSFLAAGANPDAKDNEGDTPLHIVAKKDNSAELVDLIDSFLAAGANPDVKDSNEDTPLHVTIKRNNTEQLIDLIELLLEEEADLDLKNADGLTLLHLGIRQRDKILTAMLLTYGADLNIPDNNGVTTAELLGDSKEFMRDVISVTRLGWEVFTADDTKAILEIMGREDSQQMVDEFLQSSENFTESINEWLGWSD